MTRSTSIALKRNKLVIGGVATLAVIVALLSALVLGRAAVVADDEIPSPTPVVTPEPSAPESPSEEPSETPVPSLPQAPAPAPSSRSIRSRWPSRSMASWRRAALSA